ncbi:MAG TPA: heme-binding protein [Candidatus Avisuccinivibrio pullicola]|nr:heme-binding protein [Candidatus Avisuccinivibrio pullicola]
MVRYTTESLEALRRAETTLRFKEFDLACARRLGDMLFKRGQLQIRPVACRIILNDLLVYQSFMPGTNANNNWWMDRKCRTVLRTRGSSLRALVERELNGAILPWQKDEDTYAFCGGGFPLYVKDEFSGVICVSGLPHLQDHRFVTEVIADYLNKPYILIPVSEDQA